MILIQLHFIEMDHNVITITNKKNINDCQSICLNELISQFPGAKKSLSTSHVLLKHTLKNKKINHFSKWRLVSVTDKNPNPLHLIDLLSLLKLRRDSSYDSLWCSDSLKFFFVACEKRITEKKGRRENVTITIVANSPNWIQERERESGNCA